MEKLKDENLGNSPEQEGKEFKTFHEFYTDYSTHSLSPKIFLHDKDLMKVNKNGVEYMDLVDSSNSKLLIRFHKITPHHANVNIYREGKLVYYFRLDNSTINKYSLSIE